MIEDISEAQTAEVCGGITQEEVIQAAREAGYAVGNAIEAAWDWLTS